MFIFASESLLQHRQQLLESQLRRGVREFFLGRESEIELFDLRHINVIVRTFKVQSRIFRNVSIVQDIYLKCR